MKEVGVLIDLEGQPIYWHLPEDRSSGALPDSRNLWDVIWENRDKVSGFAHTHPGYGKPGPSYTDITTFAAIETGLGRRLHWWIATGDQLSVDHIIPFAVAPQLDSRAASAAASQIMPCMTRRVTRA